MKKWGVASCMILGSLILGIYLGVTCHGGLVVASLSSGDGRSVEIASYRGLAGNWMSRIIRFKSPFIEYPSLKEFRDSNGQAFAIEQYRRLIRHGVWVEWYENGNMKQLETFVEGKKNGPRITWYDNGIRKSYEEFRDDRLQSGKYYDIDGQLSHTDGGKAVHSQRPD
jgi:hypothetical protein